MTEPRRAALALLVAAAWGGYERPATDAGILRAIADWMDRLDAIPDSMMKEAGHEYRVSRGIQADLRRIAAFLDAPEQSIDVEQLAMLRADMRVLLPRVREALQRHRVDERSWGEYVAEDVLPVLDRYIAVLAASEPAVNNIEALVAALREVVTAFDFGGDNLNDALRAARAALDSIEGGGE